MDLKLGATNTFVQGRMLDRLVGRILPSWLLRRIIPPDGLRVQKFTLSRPTVMNFFSPSATTLTAQFRLEPNQGRSKLLVQVDFGADFRWVVQGEDGVPYVQEFKGFNRQADGFISYLSTSIFPASLAELNL
jgi:hypothetical protein